MKINDRKRTKGLRQPITTVMIGYATAFLLKSSAVTTTATRTTHGTPAFLTPVRIKTSSNYDHIVTSSVLDLKPISTNRATSVTLPTSHDSRKFDAPNYSTKSKIPSCQCPRTSSGSTGTPLHFSINDSNNDNDNEDKGGISFNIQSIQYGLAWVSLLLFAATIAPGEFNSPTDTGMLTAVLSDPVHPGFNELFYTVFNWLGIVPLLLASLILPGAQKNESVPAAPFLVASAAAGYFAVGPYLVLRQPDDPTPKTKSSLGFFTRTFFENKLFNYAILLLTLSVPITCGVIPSLLFDTSAQIDGFMTLVSTSKLASVSCCDLLVLTLTMASLIPEDLKRRGWDDDDEKAKLIALATLALPILGSAIYCAWRPEFED